MKIKKYILGLLLVGFLLLILVSGSIEGAHRPNRATATSAITVDADQANIDDTGNIITATEVEGALQENRTAIDLNTTHKSSDGSDHTFIDQDVTSGSSPTFGGMTIDGGNIQKVTTVNAATYDLLVTDYILDVTYTDTGTVAIDLKTAQVTAGRIIHIKDSDFNAGANNITISTEGGEKIDEQDTYVITANGNAVSLYSDGSNWFIF